MLNAFSCEGIHAILVEPTFGDNWENSHLLFDNEDAYVDILRKLVAINVYDFPPGAI